MVAASFSGNDRLAGLRIEVVNDSNEGAVSEDHFSECLRFVGWGSHGVVLVSVLDRSWSRRLKPKHARQATCFGVALSRKATGVLRMANESGIDSKGGGGIPERLDGRNAGVLKPSVDGFTPCPHNCCQFLMQAFTNPTNQGHRVAEVTLDLCRSRGGYSIKAVEVENHERRRLHVYSES